MGLTTGIAAGKKILEALPLDNFVKGGIEIDEFKKLADEFWMAMETLESIITQKYTPTESVDNEMLLNESDPNLQAHPDTQDSGTSSESVDEDMVKSFIHQFMQVCLGWLGPESRKFHWLPDGSVANVRYGYAIVEIYNNIRNSEMVFNIDKQRVKARNDGGLCVMLRPPDGPKEDLKIHSHTKYPWPILSIETKRKSSRKFKTPDGRETSSLNHAAQMFGEMLGQVCHEEFYGYDANGYQESFVVHGRHDKFAVFYAKLPHEYLRWVEKENDKFSRPYSGVRIALKRSRFFLLRQSRDRADFFELIAKMLWYLCSGKSHVGFCQSGPNGPLHRRVMSFDPYN